MSPGWATATIPGPGRQRPGSVMSKVVSSDVVRTRRGQSQDFTRLGLSCPDRGVEEGRR